MICAKERGRGYVEEQAHGGADDRGAEASGGGAEGGRRGAREVGVSKHTIYAWKAKYGGMDVSQAQEGSFVMEFFAVTCTSALCAVPCGPTRPHPSRLETLAELVEICDSKPSY